MEAADKENVILINPAVAAHLQQRRQTVPDGASKEAVEKARGKSKIWRLLSGGAAPSPLAAIVAVASNTNRNSFYTDTALHPEPAKKPAAEEEAAEVPPKPQPPLPASDYTLQTLTGLNSQTLRRPQSQALNEASALATDATTSQVPDGYVRYEPTVDAKLAISATDKPPLSLTGHFLTNALGAGWYPDVYIRMFGKELRLHRIVLSRSMLFRRMFTTHGTVEKLDISTAEPSLTELGYDNMLRFLYGANGEEIDVRQLMPTLSAAEYFEVPELAAVCLKLCKEKILSVDSNAIAQRDCTALFDVMEYVDSRVSETSDQLETLLLQHLCADGYSSLDDVFVQMPAVWLQRVLEADAFYCPDEFSRYVFARECILRRRLARLSMDNYQTGNNDEACFEEIFRYAIIYTHMTFEQLNEVRADELVPESILMQSLWQQTRFKSSIESSAPSIKSLLASSAASAASRNSSDNLKSGALSVVSSGTTVKQRAAAESAIIAPVRVGLVFRNVGLLKENERAYSDAFFYGGSWWTAFLQRFPVDGENSGPADEENRASAAAAAGELWGVFLRRCDGEAITKAATASQHPPSQTTDSGIGEDADRGDESAYFVEPLTGTKIPLSTSYFSDRRTTVMATFKLFNPRVKVYDPVFESKPNEYAITQSWGYRSATNVVTETDRLLLASSGDAPLKLTLVVKYL